jgi:uncharacterized coiled-coil protein SlyX
MTDESFADDLVALQTKIAYQEKAIAEMSDVIYEQEQRLAKLEGFARLVAPQLQGLGFELDPTLFQKPPHY